MNKRPIIIEMCIRDRRMVITTHRYVHRFLFEIWNELVYEGRINSYSNNDS